MTVANQKFAQLQPFTLSGSGATIGATSITLVSMKDIDGGTLTMSGTFGSKGFGTMEPGNGALEEQISFTGLTNNLNGTVTLSGVSNVGFEYPYTETSGLAKTHAGSTVFIISNTSGFYNQFVAKGDDGTIADTLTFTNPNYPQMDNASPYPTLQAQLATKAYVDFVGSTGAPNATTSVAGLVQLPTQAQVDAGTATGGTGASLTPTPALLRSKLLSDYVIDTGVADAYVIAPSPAIAAYATGQMFTFKAINTNTTASTLNVNSKGAQAIKKKNGATALQAGDIVAGQLVQVEYDGTNFQLMSPQANNLPQISSSNINEVVMTTDGATFSFGRPFDFQDFTSSNTWTKPTNLSGNEMVKVQLWGAGGAGGGTTGNASGGSGGGGGGGAYVEQVFRASDLSSTVTVTIGAGGVGGSTTGPVGDNSTFGSYITAYGGGGGGSRPAADDAGGGGGGGTFSVGVSGSGATPGTGGSPLGGAANTISTFGGGGAGSGGTGIGAKSVYGGAGGGLPGGAAFFGGAGGGCGRQSSSGSAGTGGAAYAGYGGKGGDGGATNGVHNGADGAQPGGGGGGASAYNSASTATGGSGGKGECRVWVFL